MSEQQEAELLAPFTAKAQRADHVAVLGNGVRTPAREFIVMVMDQSGWHIANALQIPHNVRLVLLPPYSPEINPAEHIWRTLREDCVGNTVFASLEAADGFASVAPLVVRLTLHDTSACRQAAAQMGASFVGKTDFVADRLPMLELMVQARPADTAPRTRQTP